MKVNINIGFWALKMKCTQYGLYGEVVDIKEDRHLGRDVRQRYPNCVGRDAKSFGGQRRRWAPPTSVTPDRARWGSL